MAKEVVTGVKEPNHVTFDLYHTLMIRMAGEKWPDVLIDSSAGLTLAKVARPDTAKHDLLFYRFAHHEAPVARITNAGTSMTLITYEIGRAGTRFRITEADIQEKLKEVLNSR